MNQLTCPQQRPILSFRQLQFAYPDQPVLLHDLSLDICAGEVIVLLGPNGSGKSTLFKLMTGLLKPRAGEIFFCGERLTYSAAMLRRLRQTVGMVFQDPDHQLFASTVEQEVSFGAVNLRLDADEVRRRTDRALRDTALEPLARHAVQYLSFGQKKRVSVADLLVMHADVMLLDEPTAWLDPPNQIRITALLRRLADRGTTLVIATHDVDWAYAFGERMVLLKDGAIRFDGAVSDGFGNTALLEEAQLSVPMVRAVQQYLSGCGLAGDPGAPLPRTVEDLQHWLAGAGCVPGCGWRPGPAADPVRPEPAAADAVRPELAAADAVRRSFRSPAQRQLRSGLTTGSCATAAALASAMLRAGEKLPDDRRLTVLSPQGRPLTLPIADCVREADGRWLCTVIKDGGDDPDVTTGLPIQAVVYPNDCPGQVCFEGGEGVGRVTLPGLKVPPGEPAINPGPRAMMTAALQPYLPPDGGLTVCIRIPGGRERALKTFNPRLGVEGGLSIIGTTGIVEPMSEAALVDSLTESVHVAAADPQYGDRIVLAFGHAAERFARGHLTPDSGRVVICSNFIAEMLREAASCGIRHVTLAGPLGKIIKVSAGIFNTHSHVADARQEILVANAALMGIGAPELAALAACRTTDAALPILESLGLKTDFCRRIAERCCRAIEAYEHLGLTADCLMSDGAGRFLYRTAAGSRRDEAESERLLPQGAG